MLILDFSPPHCVILAVMVRFLQGDTEIFTEVTRSWCGQWGKLCDNIGLGRQSIMPRKAVMWLKLGILWLM